MEKSILILEENQIVQGLIASTLAESQLAVYQEQEPENFLDQAKKIQPDLILISSSDEKREYITCKQIREDQSLNDIPMVWLSNAREEEDLKSLAQFGVKECIRKPFEAAALQEKIQQYIPSAFLMPAADAFHQAQSTAAVQTLSEDEIVLFDEETMDLLEQTPTGQPTAISEKKSTSGNEVPEVDFSEDILEPATDEASSLSLDSEPEMISEDVLEMSDIGDDVETIDPSELEPLGAQLSIDEDLMGMEEDMLIDLEGEGDDLLNSGELELLEQEETLETLILQDAEISGAEDEMPLEGEELELGDAAEVWNEVDEVAMEEPISIEGISLIEENEEDAETKIVENIALELDEDENVFSQAGGETLNLDLDEGNPLDDEEAEGLELDDEEAEGLELDGEEADVLLKNGEDILKSSVVDDQSVLAKPEDMEELEDEPLLTDITNLEVDEQITDTTDTALQDSEGDLVQLGESDLAIGQEGLDQLRNSGLEDQLVQQQFHNRNDEVLLEEAPVDLAEDEAVSLLDEGESENLLEKNELQIELSDEGSLDLNGEVSDIFSVSDEETDPILQEAQDMETEIAEMETLDVTLNESDNGLEKDSQLFEKMPLEDTNEMLEEAEDMLELQDSDSFSEEKETADHTSKLPQAQTLRGGMQDIDIDVNDFTDEIDVGYYDPKEMQMVNPNLSDISLDQEEELPDILEETDKVETLDDTTLSDVDDYMELDQNSLGLIAEERDREVSPVLDRVILLEKGTLFYDQEAFLMETDAFLMDDTMEANIEALSFEASNNELETDEIEEDVAIFENVEDPEEESMPLEADLEVSDSVEEFAEESMSLEADLEISDSVEEFAEDSLSLEADLEISDSVEEFAEVGESLNVENPEMEAITKDDVFEKNLEGLSGSEETDPMENYTQMEEDALVELNELNEEMATLEMSEYDDVPVAEIEEEVLSEELESLEDENNLEEATIFSDESIEDESEGVIFQELEEIESDAFSNHEMVSDESLEDVVNSDATAFDTPSEAMTLAGEDIGAVEKVIEGNTEEITARLELSEEEFLPIEDEDKLVILADIDDSSTFSIPEPPVGSLEKVLDEMIASSVQKALEQAMPEFVRRISAELKVGFEDE